MIPEDKVTETDRPIHAGAECSLHVGGVLLVYSAPKLVHPDVVVLLPEPCEVWGRSSDPWYLKPLTTRCAHCLLFECESSVEFSFPLGLDLAPSDV